MKKTILLVLLILASIVNLFAQKPIRQNLVSIIESAPAMPVDGKSAFAKCGKECKVTETVLKPMKDKMSPIEKSLSNINPGDVEINAMMNAGAGGMPTATEGELMQAMGEVLGSASQDFINLSTELGKVAADKDDQFNTLFQKVRDEINTCPSDKNDKSEAAGRDKACVNSILQKYSPQVDKLILEYIKITQPLAAEYKKIFKEKYERFEGMFVELGYGDKAGMPSTKTFIFNIQSQIFSNLNTYAMFMGDIWTKVCSRQAEWETIKNAWY